MACALPPPGGGGKRGRDTKVSLPLLTPQPFLRTRLPPVARLNARGPQGRLVLQDTALDGSGAFRRTRRTLCTVWPRTDSAANHARQIQGLTASQNLPDARNRAPVPSVSLHISDVSAQRRVWGSQEGEREPYGALAPFCPGRWAPASPPPDGGTPRPPKAATDHAMSWRTSPVPGGRKSRLQRRAAVSAEVYRQQTVKRGGRSAPVEKRVDRPLLGMV